MAVKNRYYRHSRIAEKTFHRIIRYFAMDFPASDTTQLVPVSVRLINSIYIKLRQRLAQECAQHSNLAGHIEVDESYFGPKRIRGKRGRGAGGKTIVFGIESFWAYAKHRLAKFKGIPKHTFRLHLKETGFRFNHRCDNLYKIVLK